MIPSAITREHVIKAIEEIDRDEVPKGRTSRKFLLQHEGRTYPPKYVVGRAAYFATGKELDPESFSGGDESNGFLTGLGFTIVDAAGARQVVAKPRTPQPAPAAPRAKGHDERCSECKNRIHEMLRTIYGHVGVVRAEHRLSLDPRLESYQSTRHYDSLRRIYTALTKYRGYDGFVRNASLHPSDAFVDPPGFLVETDESQHFTVPRAIALENYPADLALGFDREEWRRLARSMGRSDPNPAYRDEQRAWYDTIRDFAPVLCDSVKAPTVRVRLGGYAWCELDPRRQPDVEEFKRVTGLAAPVQASVPRPAPPAGRVTPLVDEVVRDLRFMEYYFQEIRLLYLRWVSDPAFLPPEVEVIAGIGVGGTYKIFNFDKGFSFSMSPCGRGNAYLGGSKGSKKMPDGCYPANGALASRTNEVRRALDNAMDRVRSGLRALLGRNEKAQVWGLLQDFYWLKFGIHEFAYDLTYREADVETWQSDGGVRDILVNSMQVGQDLRAHHHLYAVSREDLASFIRALQWNRYACCAFDCGPISMARECHVTFAEFAEYRRQFAVPPSSDPWDPRLAWAKRVLERHYDLLLCYHSQLFGVAYSDWDAHRGEIRAILDRVEAGLARYRDQCVGV